MKRFVGLTLLVALLFAEMGFCEVVVKEIIYDHQTFDYFYADGETIAKQVWDDTNEIFILLEGKIPDGVVKEYYEDLLYHLTLNLKIILRI